MSFNYVTHTLTSEMLNNATNLLIRFLAIIHITLLLHKGTDMFFQEM